MNRIAPHPLREQLALVGIPQVAAAAHLGAHGSTLCAMLRGYAAMPADTERRLKLLIRSRVKEIVRTFPEEVAHAS